MVIILKTVLDLLTSRFGVFYLTDAYKSKREFSSTPWPGNPAWWRIVFFRRMKALGFADRSWNNLLKENGALAGSFAQPFAPAAKDSTFGRTSSTGSDSS